MATIPEELHELLSHMGAEDQRRVLDYAKHIARPTRIPPTPLPPGTPGSVVAKLRVSPQLGEDLERAMADTEKIWDTDITWPDE